MRVHRNINAFSQYMMHSVVQHLAGGPSLTSRLPGPELGLLTLKMCDASACCRNRISAISSFPALRQHSCNTQADERLTAFFSILPAVRPQSSPTSHKASTAVA